jgi:hypothetical protein
MEARCEANAILLPAVSDKLRNNLIEIKNYSLHFLDGDPKEKIDKSNVRTFDNMTIDKDAYTLTIKKQTPCRVDFT